MSDSDQDDAIEFDDDNLLSDDSEEEVLASEDDDDDDDESEDDDRFSRFKIELKKDEMASDLEDEDGDEEKFLPNPKAWGKDKKSYYQTDYIDKDFRSQKQKDEDLAKYEEEEALQIQKRLLDAISEQDLGIDLLIDQEIPAKKTSQKESTNESNSEEQATVLPSKLSETQKLSLIKQDSPELLSLIKEFQECLMQIQQKLTNVKNLSSLSQLEKLELLISIHYCANIPFYLAMKCSSERKNVKNHPIIKRIFIYKKLLGDLAHKLNVAPEEDLESEDPMINQTPDDSSRQPIQSDSNQKYQEEILDDDEKRAITYEMQKNKGLTPKRKREQRNPRVKYRKKYASAVVRRKGQVREPRKELKKYGGEITGINVRAIKSIKFK